MNHSLSFRQTPASRQRLRTAADYAWILRKSPIISRAQSACGPRKRRSGQMISSNHLTLSAAAIAIVCALSTTASDLRAQQPTAAGVTVGAADLGGVVTGPGGPEAGVWVI